jgi:hypothetical protein
MKRFLLLGRAQLDVTFLEVDHKGGQVVGVRRGR